MTTRCSRSGQRVHRVDEVRLALAVEDRLFGAGVVAGDERLGVAFDHERVVVEHRRPVDVVDELVHRLGRHVEHRRDLVGRRRAPELVHQLLVRGLQAAGPGPDRAARPVAAAQLVEERAPDAGRGEAVERDAALGVVAAGGLGEAQHPGRHEVAAAHVARHPVGDLRDHVLDEREVLADEVVLVGRPLDVDVGLLCWLHFVCPPIRCSCPRMLWMLEADFGGDRPALD